MLAHVLGWLGKYAGKPVGGRGGAHRLTPPPIEKWLQSAATIG